ncbi:TonB-dependent receptor [Persicobacter psychrovividus]|uniref:TonB-dependent receptor n=1 Tax=Persicobacter psychrovividus TaxID=387638 RepID=A0ABN6LD41_9BACT|nr:TonB-dependent receptor [Persicobacter psychrovividus]
MLFSFSAFSKGGVDIHGKIKGTRGESLIGIAVRVEGSQLGAATDVNGVFHLHGVSAGPKTLIISGVGYKSVKQQVNILANEPLNLEVTLKEDILGLEQVVVSANREEINRKEASVPVQVIGAKIFKTTQSITLLDGLKFQPGIRVENNCQNCGFSQVRMNGLEGGYSQILIDGRPVFSALNGVYGLEQMPTTMIDRVEVVRGGGSSLYGGNAIAGTINVITKEPTVNEFELNINQSLIDGQRLDQSYGFGGNIVGANMSSGVSVYGFFRDRQWWDKDGDDFSEVPEINNYTLGFKGYLKPTAYSKMTLEGSAIKEHRRGGNRFELPPHMADVAEALEHDIISGGFTFDQFTHDMNHKFSFYLSNQNTHRNSYYGAGQDPNAYGNTKNNNLVTGLRYNTNQPLWGGTTDLTTGVEYKDESIVDESMAYDRPIDQHIKQVGYYAQSDWQMTPKFKLLTGFRIESHNLISRPIFVPRVNGKYDFSDHFRVRAGYARGFRAPQAFDEDLHVEMVNGNTMVTFLADDLQPEYSDSFTASFDFDHEIGTFDFNVTMDAFYTKISNTFVNVPIGIENGTLKQEKRNGAGSLVQGISLTPSLANAYFTAQAGLTFQKSRHDEGIAWSEDEDNTTTTYLRTPDLYGFYALSIRPTKPLSVDFSGNYTGRMYLPHFESGNNEEDRLVHTPDFMEFNIKLNYTMQLMEGNTLEWSVGVKNITNAYQSDFDSGMDRDAQYVYGPMMPRTFFAGLKIKL